jgi:TolA-binding protein
MIMTATTSRAAGRAVLALLAALTLGGCATKKDVRTLQAQLLEMQRRQDESVMELQRQNRLLLDSVRATTTVTQDTRGIMANQLRQFEDNVRQLGQLVGEVMGTLNRIDQRLTLLEQRPAATPGGAASGGGSADQYYQRGMASLQSSPALARAAFEQLVLEFPQHERAPEAQLQIGETYYLEKDFQDAYAELEKVAERWPDSAAARRALVRAAAIAEEQRDIPRARRYYTRVRDSYRGTDEAALATRKLQQLPAR